MIRKLKYQGGTITWGVEVEVDEVTSTVTVPAYAITVAGNTYEIAGGVFILEDKDTVYVTPAGLVQEGGEEDSIPVEKAVFPETGSCYWLVSRVGDDILILEA